MIKEVTSYQTTDGKIFKIKSEAEKHQATLTDVKKLENDVKDLLNQILLKLKDVPRAIVKQDEFGGYLIVNVPQELVNLASIKDYCMNVVENDYQAAAYTENYYDSSCY